MRTHHRVLVLLLALSIPTGLCAAEDEEAGEAAEESAEEAASSEAAPPMDPLTARLNELVSRYYEGIDASPSEEETARGLESVQMMLLSDITLQDISRAVDAAIRLHTPGRRIPFEIAVPLRVGSAPDVPSDGEQEAEVPRHRVTLPAPEALSPEAEASRRAAHAAREARRSRYGLFRQWRDRTRTKRTLISVGLPILVTSYMTTFGAAGIASLTGAVSNRQAWLSAIPVFGGAILSGTTDGALVGLSVLTIIQSIGAGLVVVGVALPIDYPYKRDPTALHLGRRPDGRHALELRFVPAPSGAGIVGRF